MPEWTVPGYTQLTVLGEGGFGRVVLARHDAPGRVVAIKYLHSADEPSRAQFRHEAAILHRVVSPHVARLYAFVESPEGAAIVMEAVPGVSLKEILERHGTLTPEAALAVLKGSLLGLAAAHDVGTVHRDYKPGNVLVQPNHQSKLVDFGIALLSGHSGHSGGTPAYMAPEQWQGAPATPATDVYAATCVFFLCVTGFRPFTDTGTGTEGLRQAHQFAPPPVDQVPEPVRALVARGMAKDVTQRPASAAAFVAELEAAAVAGYGKDWEAAGWQRLAGYAGTLLALSPMAWLVSSTGVLASGASSMTAAGAAGSAAAAKTIAGTVAAKVAAAVVGVAVVTGAAVVVIETTSDPPAATQAAVSVSTRTEQTSYQTNVTVTAQVVQVSGGSNSDAVNAALRAPVDARIHELRDYVAAVRKQLRDDGDERWDDPTGITITATVLLQTENYLSVRYQNDPDLAAVNNVANDENMRNYGTATVDLRTGKALTPEAIYQPGAVGPLGDALVATGKMCESADLDPTTDLTLTEKNLGAEVKVAFTRDHAWFSVELPRLDRPNACGNAAVEIPYTELTKVLDETLVQGLTGG